MLASTAGGNLLLLHGHAAVSAGRAAVGPGDAITGDADASYAYTQTTSQIIQRSRTGALGTTLTLPSTTGEVEKPGGRGKVTVRSTTTVKGLAASGGRLWVLEPSRLRSFPMT